MTEKRQPPDLTNIQLRQLTTAAQAVRADAAEVALDLEKMPRERREELFGPQLWWAWAYELTMTQQIALHLWCLGLIDQLNIALEGSKDKAQSIFDFANNHEPDEKVMSELFGNEENKGRREVWFALLIAHVRQIDSLEREGSYLSDLVERVGNGDDEAFFKALRVDRTAISCPTFGARISRAEIENDGQFFKNMAGALKKKWKKKSPRQKMDHKGLRVALQATHETGRLDRLSMTEADELFIKELGLYSNDGEDPARGLQRFILRWKNNK